MGNGQQKLYTCCNYIATYLLQLPSYIHTFTHCQSNQTLYQRISYILNNLWENSKSENSKKQKQTLREAFKNKNKIERATKIWQRQHANKQILDKIQNKKQKTKKLSTTTTDVCCIWIILFWNFKCLYNPYLYIQSL